MSKRVNITCKDPLVAKFHEEMFGEQFDKAVAEAEAASVPEATTPDGQSWGWRTVLEQVFTARMLQEAQRQKHYNYEVVDGQRQVVYVESDNAFVPQLLIPAIEIV
jgi:hypothetical protein